MAASFVRGLDSLSRTIEGRTKITTAALRSCSKSMARAAALSDVRRLVCKIKPVRS